MVINYSNIGCMDDSAIEDRYLNSAIIDTIVCVRKLQASSRMFVDHSPVSTCMK